MHFKNPEILYFLFLLVIPILIHLFQLRKFKTEYFTNVRFLKELSVQTRKSAKLKKYLLLASRLLLLTFLIFAFAQPFFESKNSKSAAKELYIVLDNSFSMQASGKNGELLKRAVEDLLENTPENIQFSLLTCSDNYWNTDIKSIQKELQNLKYSATKFKIDEILLKINNHKSAFAKDILIITDGIGIQSKQIEKLKNDEQLNFVISKAEKTANVSIDSIFLRKNSANFYEIAVKLSSFGTITKNLPIALYNQNKLVAKTIIDFDSQTTTVNFTIPKANFQGYFSISDNSLSYDNLYYFNILSPKKCNVISIGAPEKSNFLSRIFLPDEFNFTNYTLPNLDYNSLNKQNAIILNELSDIPVALQTTIKGFYDNGGAIILIPGQEATIENLNAFLVKFGSTKFVDKVNAEKLITKINFDHPIFANVFEKRVTNFQYPKVSAFFETANPAPQILGYSDQSPFLFGFQNNLSSLFCFSAPINKTNSNFQNSPLIVPTFYNMAAYYQKSAVSALKIGSNSPIMVDVDLQKDAILKVKNNVESFIPLQQLKNGKVHIICNENPVNAGNFQVYNANQPLNTLSFNYDRTESDLITDAAQANNFVSESNIEVFFDKLLTDRTDNLLWKYLIILALLFLILELLIQKFVR